LYGYVDDWLQGATMNPTKRARLAAKGWRVGGIEELLELPPDAAAYIELKLLLTEKLLEHRRVKQLTQLQMAELLGCSRSRMTQIENGDASVSLDLLIRWLLALGATRQELARMIAA
jgi:DNA-binding XRE family transcriptional regulator